MFYMVRFIFNLKHRGSTSVSVQKKGVQVRIWQIPLRQPSRQGPLNQPGRAQCLPQSPCQPNHLKGEQVSVSAIAIEASARCSTAVVLLLWQALTFLQSLIDERLQIQGLLVPWFVPQKRSDVLQGFLILLWEEKRMTWHLCIKMQMLSKLNCKCAMTLDKAWRQVLTLSL